MGPRFFAFGSDQNAIQVYIYEKKTKIGKVSIDHHGGSFRLRFTYPKGQRHEIKVAKVNDDGYLFAIQRARQINTDTENKFFDFSSFH